MPDTKYKLRYLPLFYEDLERKVICITEELHNQKAVNDLLDTVENAIWNDYWLRNHLKYITLSEKENIHIIESM